MDRYEKEQAVREVVEMMKASFGRPRFRAMIQRRVRAAFLDALRGRKAELVDMAERLDEP